MKGDAVSLRLKSFEMRSKLCVCRWEVFTGAMIFQMHSSGILLHSYSIQVNLCVESRAAKSAAGLFLWGLQIFAAEISTNRRSLPILEFKLRLDGPARSLSRL